MRKKGDVHMKIYTFTFIKIIEYMVENKYSDIRVSFTEDSESMEGLINEMFYMVKEEGLNLGVVTNLILDLSRQSNYGINYIEFKSSEGKVSFYSNGKFHRQGNNEEVIKGVEDIIKTQCQ